MNLDPQFAIQIEHAARLHDIGKIAVNEMILLKPGRLDPQELASMRQHAQAGADMLEGTKDPTLQLAMVVARYHHEWWNGTGYPIQLSFDAIPLPARITALADVFDALTNERPYKTAWSSKQAIDEMTRFSGIQFDPNLVPAFLRVIERYLPLLAANALPGITDLSSNHLLQSRKNLMETINAQGS
jgi:putative two-component system response regulator